MRILYCSLCNDSDFAHLFIAIHISSVLVGHVVTQPLLIVLSNELLDFFRLTGIESLFTKSVAVLWDSECFFVAISLHLY